MSPRRNDELLVDQAGHGTNHPNGNNDRHPIRPQDITVLGDGPITGKTDGVVAYESAHIDGVESERVVRFGHSTQGHPETIEEVPRILREHIGAR
jgi:hypothetical protein